MPGLPLGHRASYRGRLAPSPTGLLHIGHARTFWIAAQRAIENQGTLILRNEDLDPQRSRAVFARAMMEEVAPGAEPSEVVPLPAAIGTA